MPVGVYHTVPVPAVRGAIVVVCLPAAIGSFARDRGYLGRGPCPGGVEHLGKRVAGIPGDTISIDNEGVRVDGFLIPDSRPLPSDARGRPLCRAENGVVKAGELFLMATDNRRSFDGRYFGPVVATDITVVERLIPH